MDARVGRFEGMDRAEGLPRRPQTLHKYVYTRNSPINRVDPTGQFDIGDAAVTVAVVSIGATLATGALQIDSFSPLHVPQVQNADDILMLNCLVSVDQRLLSFEDDFFPDVANLVWFYERAKPGGPWDYKALPGHAPDFLTMERWADFGNYNYGATGTALGLGTQLLLRAAGAAQEAKGWGRSWLPEYGFFFSSNSPYGDTPNDQEQIRGGIEWAQAHGF